MDSYNIICSYADDRLPEYKTLALDIFDHPETCNEEYHACEVLTAQLEKEGFTVQKDIAGHPTGFIGSFDTGRPGPVIVFLAEYDALPGMGHACGHNLFGPTSILAAAALKQSVAMLGGEIRVYGTPGEEGGNNGSAKCSFVRDGYFRDVDAALCVHPGSDRHVLTHEEISCAPVKIEFFGRASHAAAAPENGINALDAMIQVYNSVNALRQQLGSDVRIHGVIVNGGTAPNIIPDYTMARFYLRAATIKRLNAVYEKMENIVHGAALATGCTYKFEHSQQVVEDIVPTPGFDAVYLKNLRLLGEEYTEGRPVSVGSSDVGNVTHVVPTIQPMIRISDTPVEGHSAEKLEACRSETGLESIGVGAKALAMTAFDIMTDPELLASIKAEHAEIIKRQS